MKKLLFILVLLAAGQTAWGQMFPERRDVRRGNREYQRENYVEAEAGYMGALSKNPASYEGNFNLGNSLYRQGRLEEAEQRYTQLGQVPNLPGVMAQTYYNLGNSQVLQYKQTYNREKLTQALEVYKQSLRLNPEDRETKFNLAYVQKLLEQDNDGDGGGGGGNDQNNQDQNQNNDQNQNDQDQNNQDQNGDQDPDQNNDQDPDQNNDQNNDNRNEGQQPPPEGRMSREEAEQLLNAMQASEDKTREKVDKEKAAVVAPSGKNW